MGKKYSLTFVALLMAQLLFAQANFNISGVYTQDFGNSPQATWTDNVTFKGWYTYLNGNPFQGTINITLAAPSNNGGVYFYQINSGTNYMLGARPSNNNGGPCGTESCGEAFGVCLINNLGTPIRGMDIQFDWYQLSRAQDGGNANTDFFDYQVSANNIVSLTGGVWTSVPSLYFTGPVVDGSCCASQIAGFPGNETGHNNTCIKVNIPANSYIMLRWWDPNNPDNDPHMAVDNILLNAFTPTISSNASICKGDSTLISADGGATYLWSTGATTSTITVKPLTNTTYSVTIKDATCNSLDTTVTVTVKPAPAVTFTGNTPICKGDSTIITASGGSSYLWSTGATTSAITVKPSSDSTYKVSVGNGTCFKDTSFTVKVNPLPIVTISGNNAICKGDSIILTATGGGTYSWSTGATTSSIKVKPVSDSSYTLKVGNGSCFKDTTIKVKVNPSPAAVIGAQSDVKCNGGSSGSATINVSGGSAPYTYNWSPGGGTNKTVTGLSAGTYTVNINDVNGCITTTTVTITEPAAIATVTSSVDASCLAGNGSATVTASGGTGAFTYSWSPGGGTNATASGLSAGNYTVTVTDANGCVKTASALVNNTGGPCVTMAGNNAACFGATGSATATANGGTSPYTYSWSPSGGTSANATGLSAGTYTCTVTDAKGCITIDTITITEPAAIAANASANGSDCGGNDGSAAVTASGGTGAYTYNWSPSGGTNAAASNLSAGTYTCMVTDANGCSTTTAVTINNIGGIKVSISPDVTINNGDSTVLAATGGGTYTWSPATGLSCTACSNPVAKPGVTTTYCVIADSNGCKDSACVTVTVESPCTPIFVPNAFSPNGDHQNDLECVYGDCIQSFYFAIYDRWGNKVFETNDNTKCWDGTYKGQLMNSGVFDYYLKATLNNGQAVNQKGNITLIR